MGAATKDTGYYFEPQAAIYTIDHINGFTFWPNSDIVVRVNGPGDANVTDVSNLPFPDGQSYVRITKVGDSITFAYDHTYNGSTFTPRWLVHDESFRHRPVPVDGTELSPVRHLQQPVPI